MDKLRIGDKVYVKIDQFMLQNNIRTRKTVYDWEKEDKVVRKKIGSNAFFALK